jgi:hypothetical protein
MPNYLSSGLIAADVRLFDLFLCHLQCSIVDATAAFTGGIYVCRVNFHVALILTNCSRLMSTVGSLVVAHYRPLR